MSEPQDSKAPLFGGKAAVILGSVFLALYALFAVWLGMDKAQRPQLETVQAMSAQR